MTVEFSGILAEGVEIWNKWREEHPHIQPNFSDTVFSPIQRQFNKSFHQVLDLSGANFRNAGLQHASFLNTNLTNADFTDAELAFTRFSGADLTDADLSCLDLTGVDFSNAVIRNTNLSGSDLSNVKNISQEQLFTAQGDENTCLPAHISTPGHWIEAADNNDDMESDTFEHDDIEDKNSIVFFQRKNLLHRPMLLGGILLAIFSGIFVVTDAILESSSKDNPVALLSYETLQSEQNGKAKNNTESTSQKPNDKAQNNEKKNVASKESSQERQVKPEPYDTAREETISSGSANSNSSSSSVYYYPSPYGKSSHSQESHSTNSNWLDSENNTTLILDTNTGEELSGFLDAQQKAVRRRKLQRAFDKSVNSEASGNSQPAFSSGSQSLTNGKLPVGNNTIGNTITNSVPVAGKLLGQ